jgi:hypothetical protein
VIRAAGGQGFGKCPAVPQRYEKRRTVGVPAYHDTICKVTIHAGIQQHKERSEGRKETLIPSNPAPSANLQGAGLEPPKPQA